MLIKHCLFAFKMVSGKLSLLRLFCFLEAEIIASDDQCHLSEHQSSVSPPLFTLFGACFIKKHPLRS